MLLEGKKGLVIGVANDASIAWGCVRAFHRHGAETAITYLNEKAATYVKPLADSVHAPLCLPFDVTSDEQQHALFTRISQEWGRLDFVLHAIAFAPKDDLHGRFTDCSAKGFATAMDISCHSLIRVARAAEPLMTDGGSIVTMSFYGAEKVIPDYGMMGPVKAALESSMKYLAAELGARRIRVNALSPGPIKTRAASGLAHFDAMMAEAAERAPLHRLTTLSHIGETAAFLVSDHAATISGQTLYVDAGCHIIGSSSR